MSRVYRASDLAAIAALCVSFGLSTAHAHHPGIGGGSGAGAIVTIGAATLDQGQFAVATILEYIRVRELDDATLAANAGKDVHSLRAIESRSVSFAYGVTNDLTISARLPWVRRTNIREGEQELPDDPADPLPPPTVNNRGNTSGIGDLTVLTQMRFLNNPVTGTQIAALLGFKAPTGVTNRFDNFGELFDAEFQPGSGSWDGLFGAAFSQRWGNWSFHSNVLYMLVSKGTQDTDLGDRFLYNAAAVYRLFGETEQIEHLHMHAGETHAGRTAASRAPQSAPAVPAEPHRRVALDGILEINGTWSDHKRVAGVVDPNSGGNTVYLSPGLRLTIDNWAGFATFGIPIVNDPNGVQSKTDWRVLTGIAVAFGGQQ